MYHVTGPARHLAASNAADDGHLNCRIHEVIDHAPRLPEGHEEADGTENLEELNESYSTRSNWLRAAVLGANDGLVSVAAIMLGVSGGTPDSMRVLLLSGLSALVAGAMSMAAGEWISVSSQRDTEQADVDKEVLKQQSQEGRKAELDKLVETWQERGLDRDLAQRVAVTLTEKDVVRAHARDVLGIDIDEMVSPFQAAASSFICFSVGGAVPLIAAAFIHNNFWRIVSVALASTGALLVFGAIGAYLGGAKKVRAALRVLVGGWLAFLATYGVGKLFGKLPS
eukprot:jgi/Astpho2/9573/Aster-03851